MYDFMKWFSVGMVVALGISIACEAKANPVFSQHGDWLVAVNGMGVMAHTADKNEQVLSIFCQFNGQCVQGISVVHSCEASKVSLLTLNADGKIFPLNGVCFHAQVNGKTQSYYAFQDFSLMEKVIRKSNNLKVTIPLEDGSLDNYSFSLKGSSKAYDKVAELVMLSQSMGGKSEGQGGGMHSPVSPIQEQGVNEFDI